MSFDRSNRVQDHLEENQTVLYFNTWRCDVSGCGVASRADGAAGAAGEVLMKGRTGEKVCSS